MSERQSGRAPRSGDKFVSDDGVVAIRDGQKPRNLPAGQPGGRKPPWLRVRVPSGAGFARTRRVVREHRLATVCEESHCPNIGECWNHGTATIMVLGSVCTRACRFCAVDTGNPRGRVDPDEPAHCAESVALMGLGYVVITSVDRDDLADGGASHYAACVRAIKARNPSVAVEALTPDFRGVAEHVALVANSGVDVYAQNLETVERLTTAVRDPRAGYRQTLGVLANARTARPGLLTKSSLMLGLGETDGEVLAAMDDLRAVGVDILTLGQYLRPTRHHLPVARWVSPEDFARLREAGLERGFLEVAAGPLVRSSYRAERVFERNNVGLGAAGTGHIPVQQL